MLEVTFLICGEDFDVNLKRARGYIVFFKMVSGGTSKHLQVTDLVGPNSASC